MCPASGRGDGALLLAAEQAVDVGAAILRRRDQQHPLLCASLRDTTRARPGLRSWLQATTIRSAAFSRATATMSSPGTRAGAPG